MILMFLACVSGCLYHIVNFECILVTGDQNSQIPMQCVLKYQFRSNFLYELKNDLR